MRVVVNTFLTLDGVMQAPGGADEDRSGGFEHGGWQMPYLDDVAGEQIGAGMARAEGLLLGRRTYEIFAGFWPHQPDDDPIAATLNRVPKYVASRTLNDLEWRNSTLLQGDVPDAVSKLKAQPGKELQVIGSSELAQTLIEHDLVDDGHSKKPLKLVDSKTTTTGVVIATYQPER
jgi:dihydrofolate reductase